MTGKIGSSLYTGDTVAENVKKQVKSIPGAIGQQLFDQPVKPTPTDVAKQFFGKRKRVERKKTADNSQAFEFESEFASTKHQETVIFSAQEEQKKQELAAKEVANRQQIAAILAQLENEKGVYQTQVKQLKETIETVAEAAGIDLTLSIEQQSEKVGVYHVRLLEKLLKFIRTKAEEASEWSQGIVVRAQGKRPRGLQVFWQKGASQQQVTEQGTLMLQG